MGTRSHSRYHKERRPDTLVGLQGGMVSVHIGGWRLWERAQGTYQHLAFKNFSMLSVMAVPSAMAVPPAMLIVLAAGALSIKPRLLGTAPARERFRLG